MKNKRKLAFQLAQQGKLNEASELISALCAQIHDDPELLCLASVVAGKQGMYELSAQRAQDATRLAPRYSQAYYNLGNALLNAGDYQHAVEALTKASQLDPTHSQSHFVRGLALRKMRRLSDARKALECALSITPDFTEALIQLGELQDLLGKNEALKRTVTKLSESGEHSPKASLLKARIARKEGEIKSCENILLNLADQKEDVRTRTQAIHLLARVYDEKSRYDLAYTWFEKAQRLAKQTTKYHANAKNAFSATDQLIGFFRSNPAISWPQKPFKDGMRDPIFIVGFPRSGTTLTEQILTCHSRLVASDEKPFLGSVLNAINTAPKAAYPFSLTQLNNSQAQKLRNIYWAAVRSEVGNIPNQARFVDKLPLNILHLGIIRYLFPKASIVFVSRDPRDTCLSCFMQLFEANDAMAAFYDIEHTARYYVKVMQLWSIYKETINNHLCEIRYEDLIMHTEKTAQGLFQCLRMPWESGVLEFFRNKREISTPSAEAVRQRIYSRSMGRWKNYEKHIEHIFPILAPFTEEH